MARTGSQLTAAEIIQNEELEAVANNSTIYKDNSGSYQATPLGADGTVLSSNGPTSPPSFKSGGGDVIGPASATNNALPRYDGPTGKLLKDGTVTQDDNGSLAEVNALVLKTSPTAVPAVAGARSWNTVEHTAETIGDLGNVYQEGQELGLPFYNDLGVTIPNGSLVIPRGGFDVGGGVIQPTVILAKADVIDNIDGTLFMTTVDTLNGAEGIATIFGKVRDVDTSSFSPGDDLFVSPTVAGEMTNVRPEFPDYEVRLGGVIKSDVSGELGFNNTSTPFDTFNNQNDGAFRESFDFLVISDGATITGTLTSSDALEGLTMIFSDGLTTLDVSTPPTRVLTAGTSAVPQSNYVYIPKTTKVLTLSTADWPTDEHIKVAFIVLRDSATTQTDGVLRNNNWNDHIKTVGNNGHILHMSERIRQLPAKWNDGTFGSSVVNGVSDVDVAVTSGHVYQLHKQTFPALNTAVGSDLHMVNDFTSPYKTVTNLGAETTDALNVSLANRSFSIVLWGIQNKTGETSHMMINLPTGSYAKNAPSNAVDDADNLSVYDIPAQFEGGGFLIARFTYQLEADGITFTLFDTQNLRGKIPNTTAGGGGGGAGVTDWTALLDTPASYIGQALKLQQINAGESAIEFTDSPTISNTNITEATDKNYVTDADAVVIGNTSGTNTGDQTIPDNTDFVDLTTAQSVAGVKTFSASPIVPAPTTDLQAANKKYVDDNAGGGSSNVFRAFSDSSKTITTFTATKITFDGVTFQTGTDYDSTTNHRFTPSVAGKYRFSCLLKWQNPTASTYQISIYKNGASDTEVDMVLPTNVTGLRSQQISALIDANGTTDYFEVFVLQTSGSNKTVIGFNTILQFFGELAGE